MALSGQITPRFLGFGKKMSIGAFCSLSNNSVSEPHIGCGKCHPLPPEFIQDKK